MANKKTKKEFFGEILEYVEGNAELTNFVNHEIELLNQKSARRGETAKQKENAEFTKIILEVLKNAENPMTISEMQETREELAPLKNQKMSALLTKLVNEGIVDRIKEKKVTRFALIEG